MTPRHDAKPKADIQALLPHQGSLTDALRAQFTQVQLAWHQESFLPDNVWQRDVLIEGDGIPLVFARTRIDAQAIPHLPGLAQLGSTPLGDWLFQQPTCEAVHFNLRPLQDLTLTLPTLPAQPFQTARDRLYRVQGTLIWIVEIFLDHRHAP